MVVSVICPIYNEEKHIAKTIASFLAQKHSDFDLEILLLDGMSTDRTREIISTYLPANKQLKLLDNVHRKTPYAFNIGLQHASGDYIVLMGAHCSYDDDYIETCLKELIRTESAGCSGRVIPTHMSNNIQSRLVSLLLSSSFGVSSNSFRTIKEGYVHSVNFSVFKKNVLIEMGGYDTEMHRNQDNAMNQKLIDHGYKLYCTWKTSCSYFIPDTLKKIFRYAYLNGFWNVKTHKKFPGSMKIYHFIPFFFLLTLTLLGAAFLFELFITGTTYAICLLFLVLGLHLFAGILASLALFFKEQKGEAFLLPPIFFLFHFTYGYGTLRSFINTKT